jgi:aryl-phospho-beta-D-glucosidase BglC (GH1 family)
VQGWGIFDGPSDQASIAAIRTWKTNVVRVPLNEDCWLGINGIDPRYSGDAYQRAIEAYVDLLNANGLYAILDLHWSAPGTTPASGLRPMPDADHASAFWSSVATAFKANSAVLFELFSEPWPDDQRDSDAAWTCWRDGGTCPGVPYEAVGMQTLVNVVRTTGAANVIVLGGVSYSNALSQWLSYRPNDPLNDVAAAWHIYEFNVCNTIACYDSTAANVAAQAPIIASEIGVDNCDSTFLNTLLGWLDGKQLSYAAWTWNTWGGACSSLSLISDYAGTATTYGEIYRAHLAALP